MRVLHAAFTVHPEPGIIQQMTWENQAASELGVAWDARVYTQTCDTDYGEVVVPATGAVTDQGAGVLGRIKRWVRLRIGFYRWLAHTSADYDVLLLRHTTCDLFRASFIKKSKIPVFSVHHTLEVPELEICSGLEGRLRSAAEAKLGLRSIRAAAGIIAVTEEIRAYELRRVTNQRWSFVYPNGVIWEKEEGQDRKHEGNSTVIPQILFVASTFVPWHGLDLLLDDIETHREKFVLHLVGRLAPLDEYRARKDPRIINHGVLTQGEIRNLYKQCSIGLSSFALERKGMQEACTLKVREYLSVGLPVYSGHTDVFPQSFPFYRTGKASMRSILEFERSVRGESRLDIAEQARRYIDKRYLLEGLHKEL